MATLVAIRVLGWMLDASQAKEFALADWLTNGAWAGDLAQASLVSSTRFIELDAAV